jgi:asparagine synthase (glutamine-hydrolysing)
MTRVKRFLAGGDGGASERFLSMVSRLSSAERAMLYAPDVRHAARGAAARAFGAFSRDVNADRALTAAQYLDYKTFLPDDVLALADRISMAHGLEVRVPLVDHVLVEHIFPLSPREKIGWGRPKHLLRRAEANRLPPELFRAPKRGFVGPTATWLRHELRPMLSDELSPERIRRLGYFEPSVVTALLDDHMSRRRDREGILWALLCFSTWHRLVMEPAARPMQEQSA